MRNWISHLSRTPADYRMPARPSLRAVVQILKFEWRLVAVYALAFVLVGEVYSLTTPKLYESSIQLVPSDFTTKSTTTPAAGLASILLSGATQSDTLKRFVTVLRSPDLAYRLVAQNRDAVLKIQPSLFSRLFGGDDAKQTDLKTRLRRFQGALSGVQFADNKETLAVRFSYRATSPGTAIDFLKLATKEADELLRQYNLSEIRYDDSYLNKVIGTAQNVDVRMTLAQKLVETQLRRMDAERSEYFSIRALGPVQVSEGPVWPRTKLIAVGMLILGTLVGLIVAFARIYSRTREIDDGPL